MRNTGNVVSLLRMKITFNFDVVALLCYADSVNYSLLRNSSATPTLLKQKLLKPRYMTIGLFACNMEHSRSQSRSPKGCPQSPSRILKFACATLTLHRA